MAVSWLNFRLIKSIFGIIPKGGRTIRYIGLLRDLIPAEFAIGWEGFVTRDTEPNWKLNFNKLKFLYTEYEFQA